MEDSCPVANERTTKSSPSPVGKLAAKKLPPGPDRGWAWVVAFACFTINFILAGLARSSGVLYVALIELYGVSREVATTPFSMRVCVRNLSGPIVGMLGQRYGIRLTTLVGGIMAGCGGILCYLAPDVFWLTLFWGVVNGIGFGFSTVIHMMAINHYFDRYRGTAIGIGYSGDCIGTFVLPVVMEYFIAAYGVKETFLLIGAIVLNVIPMAMLLRPPPWKKDDNGKRPPVTDGKVDDGFIDTEASHIVASVDNGARTECSGNGVYVVTQTFPSASMQPQDSQTSNSHQPEHNGSLYSKADDTTWHASNGLLPPRPPAQDECRPTEILAVALQTPGSATEYSDDPPPSYDSEIINTEHLPDIPKSIHPVSDTLHKKCDSITEIHVENVSRSGSVSNRSSMTATIKDHGNVGETLIKIRALSETLRCRSDSKRVIDKVCPHVTKSARSSSSADANRNCDIIEVNRELKIQNGEQLPVVRISYENEAHCAKGNQHTELCLDARNLFSDNGKTEVEITALHRVEEDSGSSSVDRLKRNLRSVLWKTYLTNRKPIYLLICVTWAVYVLMFVSVITVVIDFALDKGVPEKDGKFLIIALSAADLAGRLSFGVVIDKDWIEMKNYMGLITAITGFLIAVMPFLNGLLFLLLGMVVFGFIQGGAAIIYPILIDKYMHKDEQSIAMGCLSFYGGILMFAMAPMIGFFRDNYGSYDGMFYIDGIMTLALGLMWFLEPIVVRCQNRYCTGELASSTED